jgi:hypothetical protein
MVTLSSVMYMYVHRLRFNMSHVIDGFESNKVFDSHTKIKTQNIIDNEWESITKNDY